LTKYAERGGSKNYDRIFPSLRPRTAQGVWTSQPVMLMYEAYFIIFKQNV